MSASDRWFDVHTSRVGSEGSRTVATVSSDITERKRREANLAFLAGVNLGFAPLLTVHEVMDQVGGQLAGYLQLSRCHFSVVDEEDDRFDVIYEYRRDENLPSVLGVHRISDDLTDDGKRHFSAGKMAVIKAAADSPLVNIPPHILEQFGLGSLIAMPHLADGRWRFLLILARAEAGEWRSDEVELLQELASKIYIRLERARVEEALRQSQECLRIALDAAQLGTFLYHFADDRGEPDAQMLALFGLPAGGTLNLAAALTEMIHPDDRRRYADAVARAADPAGDGFMNEEIRVIHPDGSLHWVVVTGQTIFEGEPPCAATMYGVAADITERKHAEEALRQSERRLQRMVNVSQVGVLTFDFSGTLLNVNDAFLAMVGYSRTEFEARTFVWQDFTPPEYVDESQRQMDRIQKTGVAGPYEKEYFRKDGSRVWLMFVAADLGDGTLVEYAIDISDRKRAEESLRGSEERFRLFVTAASDILYRMSADWNEMHALGGKGFLADTQDSKLTWLEEYIPESDQEFVRATIAEALRTKTTFEMEHRVIRADGTTGWVSSRAMPLLDERGKVAEWFGAASDISERKRAEEALRESEERARALIANLPGGAVFIVDQDERYVLAEGEALTAAGFVAADFLGKTLDEALPSDLRTPHRESYRRAFAGEPFEEEHFSYGRWFLTRGVPLRGGSSITGVMAVSYDITTRRQMEEALRTSEVGFRTLADAVPQVIWTNTAEGEADYFNLRWYEYTGLTYEESAGPGWQAIVHPDDAPSSVERWQQALAAGTVFDTEYRLRNQDGEFRWFLGRNVPLQDPAGAVVAWFGSATDIEEIKQAQAARQESEERFRVLVEGARDYAMFLLDPDGRVTFWSAGAERILGYTEAEAMGQPSALIFTLEDRERGDPEREIEQARADRQAMDRRWHVHRDGTRFWADGILMRLDDAGGALRGFAKVMRDATGQWLAEEDARRALAAVAQANAELERRFEERTARWREAAAGRQDLTRRLVGAEEEERRRLSRELHDQTGQHLTGLMLGLDALRASQPVGGESAALAERLRQAASDLSREVHQLAWDLRPPALDDIGLSQTLLSYVQEWGQRTGVAADFFAPDWDGDRLAPEVETALYRVVQEGLTNAARHARAGRVSVVLERRDVGAVLVVEDDGVGFDVSATLASPARLGLRGMRERVEMIGGTLEIESGGDGTTLVVNIPVVTQGAATEETTAEAPEDDDA